MTKAKVIEITVSGFAGAGKSTLASCIAGWLTDLGHRVQVRDECGRDTKAEGTLVSPEMLALHEKDYRERVLHGDDEPVDVVIRVGEFF